MVAAWVVSLLAVAVLLLVPPPAMPRSALALYRQWRLDFGVHAVLFGWLMLVPHGLEWGRKWRVALSMGLAVMALGLELAQGLTGYRGPELGDAIANLAGIWMGAWVGRRWRGGETGRAECLRIAGQFNRASGGRTVAAGR